MVITKGNPLTLFASSSLMGDMLLLLNAIVWSCYTLYGKKMMLKYSPFTLVAYIHILGTLMLLPLVLIPNRLNSVTLWEQIPHITLSAAGSILYLAALCSVYGYYIWYKGITEIGAVRTASFYYVSPLFALLAGIWLVNEPLTYFDLIGGIMVVSGIYMINKYKIMITKPQD